MAVTRAEAPGGCLLGRTGGPGRRRPRRPGRPRGPRGLTPRSRCRLGVVDVGRGGGVLRVGGPVEISRLADQSIEDEAVVLHRLTQVFGVRRTAVTPLLLGPHAGA